MEKELNYLSEKIEELEESIDLCKSKLGEHETYLKALPIIQNEKILLENILNKLAEIALTQ